MLTTRQKIALARVAATPFRWLAGARPGGVRVRRRGLNWCLDLDEGIDFAIYLLGGFELATLRAYRRAVRPGFVVLDVGANIGAHSLPLARLVGPEGLIVAFEPTEFAYAKLCANLRLNPELSRRIRAERIVLLDSPDAEPPATLAASWPLRGGESAHHRHGGVSMSVAGARATSLDAYLSDAAIERVDLIKLDVDGNEYPVLCGARETLARHRPIIVFELAPHVMREAGRREADLLDLLHDAGYELARAPAGPPLPREPEALLGSIPDGASLNLWARPGA